jgi:hypothetical protein
MGLAVERFSQVDPPLEMSGRQEGHILQWIFGLRFGLLRFGRRSSVCCGALFPNLLSTILSYIYRSTDYKESEGVSP